MYADPSHKRIISFRPKFTEDDANLIKACAQFRKTQPNTLLHDVAKQIFKEMKDELPEEIKREYGID